MIVIDPGHGGSDPGAVGNNIVEKDLNLEISQYQQRRFKELGIPVVLTRNSDETVPPNERTQRVLDAFGNSKDVIVLSNHINAGGGAGAETIYALRNDSTLAQSILNEIGNAGQIKRKAFQRRSEVNPSKDYYFMHRNTGDTQAVIVEYGFLDNAEDAQRLNANWQTYAEAVVKAVTQYLGKPYTPPGATGSYFTYTVQSGDSLWEISRKFNTTVEAIIKLNNLPNANLSVGQTLKIPTNSNQEVYIVQYGDSLYTIAKKFGITVDQLKRANNLTSDLLDVNQKLIIPKTSRFITYEVQPYDSLYLIAKRYNTTVDELRRLNGFTSDLLQIGQKLKIEL